MPHSSTLSVGLDVHQDAIAAAYAPEERGAEVVSLGPLGTRRGDLETLVRTLRSEAQPRLFASEAGPCGDWLYRHLTRQKLSGWVVAPSVGPKPAGGRLKTDRRGAVHLARLMRCGALTPGYGPAVEGEAIRALARAREGAIRAQGRQGPAEGLSPAPGSPLDRPCQGGPAHPRRLSEVGCPTPAQQLVLQEYVQAVPEPHARLPRREAARQDHAQGWRLSPLPPPGRFEPCAACSARGPPPSSLNAATRPDARTRDSA